MDTYRELLKVLDEDFSSVFTDDKDKQREEYERGEIESAQSIDYQRSLGNKKAGM